MSLDCDILTLERRRIGTTESGGVGQSEPYMFFTCFAVVCAFIYSKNAN